MTGRGAGDGAPRVLVVGAGFSGAVYARTLADAGVAVRVIDKRPHVAGNAYDEIGPDGIRIHRYGPHLFHTAMPQVIAWIGRFAAWTPFTHRVRALLPDGALAPLPINLDTINQVFGTTLADAGSVEAFLKTQALAVAAPANAADYLASRIGTRLTDLFFRPYTRKMWGLDLEDMAAAVVKRIPLRSDRRDTYFPDTDTQLMPSEGYAAFFASVFDHPLIRVDLDTPFHPAMRGDVDHCFAAMPIDEFYGYAEGELPYRSIRFHHTVTADDAPPGPWRDADGRHAVVNFTDDGPCTRETAWHRLPGHLVHDRGRRVFTREEPCDYKDNGWERYYPVKTSDGANDRTYARYVARAGADAATLTFIGRCGTYRYLDMDQVVNQSLAGARDWLARAGRPQPA